MSIKSKDRAVLRKYLLGALPEAERSRLADRYFVDEGFFDELLDVENELLDQYVRGQLSPEERTNFGEYLTGLPDGAGKLATAQVLMEAARERRETLPASLTGAAALSTSRWIPAGRLPGRGLVWQYAIVAILIGSLGVLGYLILTQRRLRSEAEQLRAARIQVEQEQANLARQTQTAAREQAVQHERIRQLEAELDQARRNDSRQITNETAGAVVASLVLTPALRSGGGPDLLTVTPATRIVSLVIPVANEEQTASYRVVLQTTKGQLVFSQDRLRPHSQQQGRTVTCRLAAARLTAENYKLTLLGKAADGVEIARDFYFNLAGR